tara:strand:- start:192 stop:1583 length:1392 start_codon:yes stop_codon:yes gene_type:complete
MTLYLSNKDKLELLKNQEYSISKHMLKIYLKKSEINTLNLIEQLLLCKNLISEKSDNCINPICWQFGHISHFYIVNTLELLNTKNKLHFNILKSYINQIEEHYKINFNEFFDSFKTPRHIRFSKKISIKTLKTLYTSIMKILYNYIKQFTLDSIDNYLIILSILHNDMHNENFIFSYYNLQNNFIDSLIPISISNTSNKPRIENTFINISKGFLHQGHNINKNRLVFDNETPTFLKKINEFSVSKYPITEYEYLDFINNNGYIDSKNWSQNGLDWKNKNDIYHPLYWFDINGIWYRKHFNNIYKVGSNLPVCNISWYEAEAYCKWKNVRLIKESEWEYLATNLGRNLYPWGDTEPTKEICNINNVNNYCTSVELYESGNNIRNISQLIGNVWEWCEEEIYPYNNFTMDCVYKEMSYPYFGKKKICRGGCFAVSDFLIHSKYRNAQEPGCQIQYIGFRVCLKSS